MTTSTIPKYDELMVPALKLLSQADCIRKRDFDQPLAQVIPIKRLDSEFEDSMADATP